MSTKKIANNAGTNPYTILPDMFFSILHISIFVVVESDVPPLKCTYILYTYCFVSIYIVYDIYIDAAEWVS